MRCALRQSGGAALAIAVAAAFGAPILWMLSTSLKDPGTVLSYPVRWLPLPPTLENYAHAFRKFPVAVWFRNSVAVALITTLLAVVIHSLGAYALARMRFRGSNVVFMLILGTLLVPAEATLVPLFLMLSRFGLTDTYGSLVLPVAANAFGLFLLAQFFKTIPSELEDAARIDGCGHLATLTRVVLPLSKPALATAAIFVFMASWNNFLWPLIVCQSDATRTLPVGLVVTMGGPGATSINYGLTMAAASIVTLPALGVFLALQRYFVQGIATTGMKS